MPLYRLDSVAAWVPLATVPESDKLLESAPLDAIPTPGFPIQNTPLEIAWSIALLFELRRPNSHFAFPSPTLSKALLDVLPRFPLQSWFLAGPLNVCLFVFLMHLFVSLDLALDQTVQQLIPPSRGDLFWFAESRTHHPAIRKPSWKSSNFSRSFHHLGPIQ